MRTAVVLILPWLLLGCAAAVPPAPRPPPVDQRTLVDRPAQDAELSIAAWHRVVSPQEIRGVIVVRNLGDAPLALVDRRNSAGSEQWCVVVDGRVLANPQTVWAANSYSETVLAAHEVRVAPFVLRAAFQPEQQEWNFIIRGKVLSGRIDGATGEVHYDPPPVVNFTASSVVRVVFDGQRAEPYPADRGQRPALYRGQLSAPSTKVDGEDRLVDRLTGPDLRPLPTLR